MVKPRDRKTGLYQELGEPVKSTAFSVFERQIEALDKLRDELGLGRSEIVREAIDFYLSSKKPVA